MVHGGLARARGAPQSCASTHPPCGISENSLGLAPSARRQSISRSLCRASREQGAKNTRHTIAAESCRNKICYWSMTSATAAAT
jgi:hypothetical protein